METTEETFARGELVWAKLTGYPWWPGAIVEADQNQKDSNTSMCIVKFLGQNSHSVLPLSKLAKYSQYQAEYSKKASGNRKLKQSIIIAENILKGKLSVEELIKRVKCSLSPYKDEKNDLKTVISIEDQNNKQLCQTETTETSFYPLCQNVNQEKKAIQDVQISKISPMQLEENDQQVMTELQKIGINENNVIDLLQYGLINRLSLVNKCKADQLKAKARVTLIDKFFSRSIPKSIQNKQQKSQNSKQSTKSISSKRKKIAKSQKQIRSQKPTTQIQFLCVKRLFNILRLYQVNNELSRKISVRVVNSISRRYQTNTLDFQREYLSFVQKIKQQSQNAIETIADYDKYYEGQQTLIIQSQSPLRLI